ncbi:MAG TPA: 4-hydroxy-tetrahydrodipicolinate synthase [Tepidisphaeraceae bacterium]|jgi:4-hydroxy-tetrahydrodipicolinate synthase|nr:4-hydroxy-tetrahydrodipicolinate synthase [Tepidisphaeraceae bacterium]
MQLNLHGAMTAMITPFRDGRLDESRLKEQIERQISAGIDGLVPVGTTGESPTLNFPEHERVIELTVLQAAGRVPVIAGVGGNATSEALELHSFAKKIGATAGLSVNPYYNKPTQEGLYRHFMTLADKVDLPIVLYNIPGRTSINMTPQTVARLAQHPNIIAIKESTGDLAQTSEIRSLSNITILAGDDALAIPMMAIGAKGVISVASNLVPSQIKQMIRFAAQGRYEDAAAIHHNLYPLIRTLFLDGNPVGIKHAMALTGMDTGELRLPLVQASEGTQAAIAAQLKRLGIA